MHTVWYCARTRRRPTGLTHTNREGLERVHLAWCRLCHVTASTLSYQSNVPMPRRGLILRTIIHLTVELHGTPFAFALMHGSNIFYRQRSIEFYATKNRHHYSFLTSNKHKWNSSVTSVGTLHTGWVFKNKNRDFRLISMETYKK